ncbi:MULTISPECIES: TonB-dependent receptor [Sphingomonadales]|jgi:iron complex outermembrane receptor protein|nr:TonB-dependent receptor [Rhizorhabdus wittichii DC-6]
MGSSKFVRGASLIAIAGAFAAVPPAYAQGQAGVEAQSGQDGSSGGLEEIVVTAQKRSENAQKVAATVTVVNAEALVAGGVTDLRGVASFLPMTNLSQENVVTQAFIRGIGQTSDAETNDPAVATNIDGVYQSRYTLSGSMFDIERVEVLAGPQGTLYGRNAAGGAINITTKLPQFTPGGEARFEIGNYNRFHGFGAINVPLSQQVALRGAVDYLRHDGYLSNGQNAKDNLAARLTALIEPDSDLTIVLRGEYQHTGGDGDGIVLRPLLKKSDPWFQPEIPGEDFYVHRKVYKGNAEIKYQVGGPANLSVTYIPAYTYYDLSYRSPIGYNQRYYPNPGVAGNPLTGFAGALENLGDTGRQLTNELRLAGDTGRLNFVLGLFQFRQSAHGPGVSFEIYNPGVFSGGSFRPYSFASGGPQNDLNVVTNSKAIFGQATYAVTDALRFTVGGRYSWDKRHADGVSQGLVPIANIALPPIVYDLRLSDNRFDWKVGVEADVAPHSMAYATVQTGYIGSGFNITSNAAASTFKPETLTAYTVGLKNSLFGNSLRLNLEAFYYDYRQLQVSAYNSASGSALLYNVPKSEIYGLQVDTTWKAGPNTTFTANLGYLHATIKRGVLPPGAVYTCGVPGAIPAELCNGNSLIDYSGFTLPNAPRWSGSTSVTQIFPLASGAAIEARGSMNFESKSWGLFSHLEGLDKPAFAKIDASLTYRSSDERWALGLWVRNLTNNARYVTPTTTNVYGLNTWFIDAPRTAGVKAELSF